MRKKYICGLAAAAVLTAALFSGCGDGKGGYDKLLDKNDPVTIKIWHYYNGV